MEGPLPVADSHPALRWNPWEITSHAPFDAAQRVLLISTGSDTLPALNLGVPARGRDVGIRSGTLMHNRIGGLIPPELMLTMSGDEPAVMCWR